MKSKLKGWLKYLPLYNIIQIVKDIKSDDIFNFLKWIFIIFSPLIVISIVVNFMILTGSFIMWELPDSLYIPFYGNNEQHVFDRFLILLGFIILFFYKKDVEI
jgi:hypothetical protein